MDSKNVKALLVEDSSTYALLIREYLAQSRFHHFELVHHDLLGKAIDRARGERFDIVLLDLGLPDSFGIETLKRFHEAVPALPIIVLSANTDDEVSLGGVSQGAQDYLVKGTFDETALLRAIHYAMERKKIERFKEEFGSLVSHELRAPLAVIKGAVDGVRDGAIGTLNDKQRTFLDLAGKHLRRLSKIITNILDLARYESGRVEIETAVVDLPALFKELLESIQPDADARHLTIATHCDDGLALHTDADLLFSILYNLVGNALRFARSRITITATADAQTPGVARFHVRDDGPGIHADKLADIFNKFSAFTKKSRGRGYTGTGLGLSICKSIVTLLGGEIGATNAPGGGGSFWFTVKSQG